MAFHALRLVWFANPKCASVVAAGGQGSVHRRPRTTLSPLSRASHEFALVQCSDSEGESGVFALESWMKLLLPFTWMPWTWTGSWKSVADDAWNLCSTLKSVLNFSKAANHGISFFDQLEFIGKKEKGKEETTLKHAA
ncbi:hypothetical protein OPV22_013402 [Ensete ventricosum]|uniref:Uncharacterized protein n=1 Tax=Ensete ventricosum TaxID=4639 RepID=A0AAV8R4V4_ENSVE|nr:hypothetical protein OPV22_013402 [Ensete ventricosum]